MDAKSGATLDVINPVNGKVVGKVAAGDKADVDAAVKAADRAHQTVWGGESAFDSHVSLVVSC